jgi:hypothetical protein
LGGACHCISRVVQSCSGFVCQPSDGGGDDIAGLLYTGANACNLVFQIGPRSQSHIGCLLSSLLYSISDPALHVVSHLPAAFTCEKKACADQPQRSRKRSEQAQGRISQGRGDRSYLQGVFLSLSLDRIHEAFPLSADIVADFMFDMRRGSDCLEFRCSIANAIA